MANSSTSSAVQNNIDPSPPFTTFTKSNSMPDAFVIDNAETDGLQSRTPSATGPILRTSAMKSTAEKVLAHHAAFCDICSVLLSSRIDYESHIKGRKHLLVMKNELVKNPQYKQPRYDELCLRKQELLTQNGESKTSGDSQTEKTSAPPTLVVNNFICHLCNVICNSQAMLDDHNNGKKHHAKVKLNSQPNGTTPRSVVDINPSSSNYCDVCSVQLTSETKLAEHFAHKRHQQRVKDEEYCAKEAIAMNINFKAYETISSDDKNGLFAYECTKCNKKFGNKIQLIGHLKSIAHVQMSNPIFYRKPSKDMKRSNRPDKRTDPVTSRRAFTAPRGSHQPVKSAHPPYRSQATPSSHAFNRTYNQETSTNIFGAFDPDNIYSAKRPAESTDDSTYYGSSYPKRTRTYPNNDESRSSQYSYPPYESSYQSPNYSRQSSKSQTYSPPTANFNNSPAISKPPVPYYENSYDNQYSNSYTTPHYDNSREYSPAQPLLPDYEPAYLSAYSTSSSSAASHDYYSNYSTSASHMSDQDHYSYSQQPFSY